MRRRDCRQRRLQARGGTSVSQHFLTSLSNNLLQENGWFAVLKSSCDINFLLPQQPVGGYHICLKHGVIEYTRQQCSALHKLQNRTVIYLDLLTWGLCRPFIQRRVLKCLKVAEYVNIYFYYGYDWQQADIYRYNHLNNNPYNTISAYFTRSATTTLFKT